MQLSMLDNCNVYEGRSHADAVHETVKIAREAEASGYHRYWLAEHHNLASAASSASAIILGQIASVTSNIRVGFGGALPQNTSPLLIAEQCGTLESFFAGRIDLGVGRTTGSDGYTSRYLRRGAALDPDEAPKNVRDLLAFLGPDDAAEPIKAYPGHAVQTPLWILGSGLYGATLAAHFGLPYAFASHFAPQHAKQAIATYKSQFRPSRRLAAPYALATINVIAADTSDEAAFLATTQEIYYERMYRGDVRPLPQPVSRDSNTIPGNPPPNLEARVVGTSNDVGQGLVRYAEDVSADELMVHTMIYDLEARKHSVRLTMEGFTKRCGKRSEP